MADTVTSQTILDTPYRLVMKFTNVSDGTGESAVKKVDVSSFTAGEQGATCTGVTIDRIYFVNDGMKVQILWDATTDVEAYKLLDTEGYYDFSILVAYKTMQVQVKQVTSCLQLLGPQTQKHITSY